MTAEYESACVPIACVAATRALHSIAHISILFIHFTDLHSLCRAHFHNTVAIVAAGAPAMKWTRVECLMHLGIY